MQCLSCGTPLPEDAAYCPACATPTPSRLSLSPVTPDGPTSLSSSSPPPPPTVPATGYGSDPYEGALQNPYEPHNPYAEPLPLYALPAHPGRRLEKTLLIAALATVLVLVVGGVVGWSILPRANQVTSKFPPNGALSPSRVATTVPTARYPFSTHLVRSDPLSNGNHAATYGWGESLDQRGGCAFSNGAYEVTAHQNALYCPAHHADFSNCTYEIQMRIKAGGTGAMGGVIFRHELGTGKNYLFLLGVDGSYKLDVNTDYSSGSSLRSGTISGFALGFNQLHTIGIVAKGQEISVYVDQNHVTQVSDPTYASGAIGMLSRSGTSSTTVAFTNAKVWQL